jgi:hypothetical protein
MQNNTSKTHKFNGLFYFSKYQIIFFKMCDKYIFCYNIRNNIKLMLDKTLHVLLICSFIAFYLFILTSIKEKISLFFFKKPFFFYF